MVCLGGLIASSGRVISVWSWIVHGCFVMIVALVGFVVFRVLVFAPVCPLCVAFVLVWLVLLVRWFVSLCGYALWLVGFFGVVLLTLVILPFELSLNVVLLIGCLLLDLLSVSLDGGFPIGLVFCWFYGYMCVWLVIWFNGWLIVVIWFIGW